MKKLRIGFLFFSICILFLFFLYKNLYLNKESSEYNRYIENSTILKSNDFNNTNYNLLIFIDTTCDICSYKINELTNNYEKFKNINIYLLYNEDDKNIKKYIYKHNLNKYSNIKIKSDKELNNLFNVNTYPFILMFNKKLEFLKFYKNSRNLTSISNDIKK